MIWVWGILAALLILLLVPVRGIVLWRTGSPPNVTLAWLFFKYRVFAEEQAPGKAPKKQKRRKPKKREKPKPPTAKTPEQFTKQLGLVVDLLGAGRGALGFFLRRFRLYRIKLDMIVAKEDAARTAIAFGQANAAVYGAYAVAKNILNLGVPDICIRPDFTAGQGDVKLEIRGKLSPMAVIATLFRGGGSFLWRTLRRGHLEQAQKNETKDQ